MYIVVIVFTILLLAYFFYKNRIIGSIFWAEGQFIKIGETSYIQSNKQHHSSKEKLKYIGIVKYKGGTKAKVYRIKNCENCIFAYDGTPKIFIKE